MPCDLRHDTTTDNMLTATWERVRTAAFSGSRIYRSAVQDTQHSVVFFCTNAVVHDDGTNDLLYPPRTFRSGNDRYGAKKAGHTLRQVRA